MYFVSKPNEEAKSFIQAAGLTDETQCKAIGTLVLDLKNYNLWDKMKAIYPMVGQPGVSSSFEFNLKDPNTFRGTFYGTWSFADTGATPDGATGYMDTNLNTNTDLEFNNIHISIYSRENINPSSTQAWGSAVSPNNLPIVAQTFLDDKKVESIINSWEPTQLVISDVSQNLAAMFISSRISSIDHRLFRNNIQLKLRTTANNQTAHPNISFTFGALNIGSSRILFNNFQNAFCSLGDGLTTTEAANLYTAVQRFQTTLGRQV